MANTASAASYDVIVIGAGMGGLTAAALAAKAGKKVLLVEKAPRPGGFVAALVHGPHQFDTAARLIMGCSADSAFGPGPIFTLLDHLGVRDECEFVKVQPFCTMRMPGTTFQMWSGRREFVDGLGKEIPAALGQLPRLLELCADIYRGFISYTTALSPWALLRMPFEFPSLIRYRNATLEDVLARFIPEPRSRTAVASLWPYIGLAPRRASFLMWATMMASYIEEGAFFCKGGLHRLADAVAGAFVRDGGELVSPCAVTKILLNDRAVRGVLLANGQEVLAPVVLCGTDCRLAFDELLDPPGAPRAYRSRLKRLEPSFQAIDVSLVTDLDLPALGFGFETLVFDSWDMEEVWRHLSTGDIGIFSLTVTTAVDPSLAPPGHHLVSSICGSPPTAPRSQRDVHPQGARLLREIGKHVPGLADHLTLAKDPLTAEGYVTQEFGPVYGWAASPRQIGATRLGPRTPIHGLQLVGHWTRPGHGVLAVVLSGMAAARTLLS